MASDFTTHSGSISSATAIARGDLPAAGGAALVGATGFATGGGGVPASASVPPDAKWANMLMSEIANVIDLKLGALDPLDYGQMATALEAILAIESASFDTGPVTTLHKRLVAASTASQASGEDAFVVASITGVASALNTLVASSNACSASNASATVLSSDTCAASGAQSTLAASRRAKASGTRSIVLASHGSVADDVEASGDHAAAIACYGAAAGTGKTIVAGEYSAALASGADSDVDGDYCVSIASENCTVGNATNGTHHAAIASTGMTLATAGKQLVASIASSGSTISAGGAVVIGCKSNVTADQANSVALASDGGGGFAAQGPEQVFGGYNALRRWRIDSRTGSFFSHVASPGSYNSSGADYAEYFRSLDGVDIAKGTLLTRKRKGVKVAGDGDCVDFVVSTSAAVVGNGKEDGSREADNDYTLCSMLGQVPVKVDATISNEAIDAAESGGCELYVKAMDGGIGGASAMPSRIVAMEMIEDGLCMCLIR